MTTFIDFRYSAAQAAALRQDYVEIEESLGLSADSDGYLVFDLSSNLQPGELARIGELSLLLENDLTLSLRTEQKTFSTQLSIDTQQSRILAVRFGPEIIGVKYNGIRQEFVLDQSVIATLKDIKLSTYVRIMGHNTDRAVKWGRLFYTREQPSGFCVEVIMDWQNPQSGIPSNAIATVEEFICQSDFKIMLNSYACDQKQASESDFARLFSTDSKADITLHIAPPIYTRANPDTINIGLFVVESENVATPIVNRCNEMDALIVPTNFVKDAFRNSGVKCPITVIPHGVDTDFFRPVSKKSALKSGKNFNILAIAAYTERKNIYHLARAYMEEFRINEDIALHLYLRPEYLSTQHNILQEFTEWENWHFNESGLILISTSYVSRTQLRDLYVNADLYLMPSNEGFGFTLLEAMASGTAAVGLKYGGQVDFMNSDNSYLIDKANKYICSNMDLLPYIGDSFYAPNRRQLKKTLRYLFNNRSEIEERGRRARDTLEAKFTWHEVGKALIQNLKQNYYNFNGRTKAGSINMNKQPQPICWLIGVIDDINISAALRAIQPAKKQGSEIICLFTRYGDVLSAQKAKRQGILLYRWDTTIENFRTLVTQLVKSPWAGLIYANESFSGQLSELNRFLEQQTEEVAEVQIKTGENYYESRFFRPSSNAGKIVKFDGFRITSDLQTATFLTQFSKIHFST